MIELTHNIYVLDGTTCKKRACRVHILAKDTKLTQFDIAELK